MATKHGAFLIFGGYAPKETIDIINNQDYTLSVKKTWIEPTEQWHLEFTSKLSDYPCGHSFEMFLTHAEIAKLKDIL